MAAYNAEIAKALKASALTLKSDAYNVLRTHLVSLFGPTPSQSDRDQLKHAIGEVLSKVKEGGLASSVLGADQVRSAISALASGSAVDLSSARVIDVIPAFDMPRFHYDAVRRVFVQVQHARTKFGSAVDKADMLRSRYELMLQRLLRLPEFQSQAHDSASSRGGGGLLSGAAAESGSGSSGATEIVSIESLMGQVGRRCIFGQLVQLTEGVYSLEDLHANIQLDLSSPRLLASAGLLTEGSMLLVEGETRHDGVFEVCTLISPPPEARARTLQVFPQLDWLESDLTRATGREAQLKLALLNSEQHRNDMLVFVSELHLDSPTVLARFSTLLSGLASSVPPLFVLMGNFSSHPFSNAPGEFARLKSMFDSLADTLAKFPQLCRESHFVLIPGPGDLPASMGSSLPCAPLPSALTAKLRERLLHVSFGTNPCRVSWITKELLFFRHDLLHSLRRSCVRPPSESETTDLSAHLVKTVVDQGHLLPLPLDKRPVYWNYDHALRLYPLPDLLLLADTVDQYQHAYEGVRAINPGTFAADFEFVVYMPAQDRVELSKIKSTD